MNKRNATIGAFVVAAIVPAVLWPVAMAVGNGDSRDLLITMATALYVSTLATVFLGVPLFIVINRLGALSLWSILAGAAIVGAIVGTVVPIGALVTCGLGVAAGLSFWLTRRILKAEATNVSGVRAL